MKFGDYYLEQDIREVGSSLNEVPTETYKILGRAFADEKIYQGSDVLFLEMVWDCVLAATGNHIYKISVQHNTPSTEDAESLFNIASAYFTGPYGEPVKKRSDHCLWETPELNIVLGQVSKLGFHMVNITVTSGSPFKQLPSAQVMKVSLKLYFGYLLRRIRLWLYRE